MSAEPAWPGPIDCLRRGLRSLRANWQLVPVVATQWVLTLGLTLAGLFILLAALGVSALAWWRELGPDWPQRLADGLATSLEAPPPVLLPLAAPLLAAALVWSLAFGLYCYLQGGAVGVLAEGEIEAEDGLPGWRSFRRFSLTGFDLQGRLLFWRYFWLNHLLAAVVLVWTLLLLGLVVLAVRLGAGPDAAVGIAVGCVGLVPLALLLFAITLWSMLATVEVARPGARVWAASRRALTVLRRRLGAVLLVWLLGLAGWLAVGAAVAPLKWVVAVAARDQVSLWLAGRGALMLVETLAGSAVLVALVATLAALVGLRPEAAAEAA